jgi:hypothetical protein
MFVPSVILRVFSEKYGIHGTRLYSSRDGLLRRTSTDLENPSGIQRPHFICSVMDVMQTLPVCSNASEILRCSLRPGAARDEMLS